MTSNDPTGKIQWKKEGENMKTQHHTHTTDEGSEGKGPFRYPRLKAVDQTAHTLVLGTKEGLRPPCAPSSEAMGVPSLRYQSRGSGRRGVYRGLYTVAQPIE